MTKNGDVSDENKDFLKQLFKTTKEPKKGEIKAVKEKKEDKPREACPNCGEEFISVGRHLPYCDKNPKNIERVTPTVESPTPGGRRVKETVTVQREVVESPLSELMTELKPLLRNLSSYIKKLNEEPIKVQIVK